jgi:hypothetical protein
VELRGEECCRSVMVMELSDRDVLPRHSSKILRDGT